MISLTHIRNAFFALVAVAAAVTGTHELAQSSGATVDVTPGASASPVPIPDAPVAASASSLPTPMLPESPRPVPTGGRHFGDLTHLKFSATGNLSPKIVSPKADFAADMNAVQVTVATVRGAGVELQVNDVVVPAKQLGEQSVDIKSGETRYTFYGVPLHAGPNTLRAIALGADSLRSDPVVETVYGPGDPNDLVISTAEHIVADGKTPFTVSVSVRDRWHHAAMPGSRVQLTILSGNVRVLNLPASKDASPAPNVLATGANDTRVEGVVRYDAIVGEGGIATVMMQPGLVSGPVEVDAQLSGLHARVTFYVEPYLRKPFVDGFATIGAGPVPGNLDGDGTPDAGNSRKHDAGLYASGGINKSSLLTVVYAAKNRLAPLSSVGPFVEDPNERPYLTYGDSSSVSSELKSNDHLYARLENTHGSLMWGQYAADTGATDVGGYHQLLSGAKLDLTFGQSGSAHLDAFSARNTIAFISQVLPALGLSSLQQNLRPNIVVGSDNLQLVAISRQTGAVISQVPLVRNVDYTIDYATGVLRFINIPLPYDSNFNPQSIYIQYQYSGPGIQSQTTGGSLLVSLGSRRQTKLRLGYVNDATGTQNFALFSQSLSHTWQDGYWSIAHAGSYGSVPDVNNPFPATNHGSAYSFNLQKHGLRHDLTLLYQLTSESFTDPFGGLSTPGLTNYRAAWRYHPGAHNSVELSYSGQNNTNFGTPDSQTNVQVTWRREFTKQLLMTLGFVQHNQRVGSAVATPATPGPLASPTFVQPANTSQTIAQIGLAYKPTERLTFALNRFQTISGSDVGSTQPTQTEFEAAYATANRGRIYIRDLQSDQPAASFANSTQSLSLGVASTNSLQFGFQQDLSKTTNISNDYTIAHTGDGTTVYDAVGVQQKLHFGKNVGGTAFYQHASSAGQNIAGFSVYGIQLTYLNSSNIRAGLSYQTRSGLGGGSTYSLGLAGKISPVFSTIGSFQHAYGQVSAVNDRISIAHRSLNNDRLVSLFDYTRNNGNGQQGGINNVVSLEELWRPRPSTEIAGRFAYKLSGDTFYLAHTSMFGVRVRQNVGKRLDIGAEFRQFAVPSIAGARSSDFAAETGYQAGSSVRIAAGYNFSKSLDPSLTGQPQRKGFYITITTLIDSIFGWGKH